MSEQANSADNPVFLRIEEIKRDHYHQLCDEAYLLLQAAMEAQATGQIPQWILNLGQEPIPEPSDRAMERWGALRGGDMHWP